MSRATELLKLVEGSSDIYFVIPRKALKPEITKEFDKKKSSENDDEEEFDGYTGDFRTIDKVDFKHLDHEVFGDLNSALEFALKHAEKWETAVAVYFKKNGSVSTLVAGWGAN